MTRGNAPGYPEGTRTPSGPLNRNGVGPQANLSSASDTLAQAVQFAKKASTIDGTAARLEAELDKLNGQMNTAIAVPFSEPQIMLPAIAGVGP